MRKYESHPSLVIRSCWSGQSRIVNRTQLRTCSTLAWTEACLGSTIVDMDQRNKQVSTLVHPRPLSKESLDMPAQRERACLDGRSRAKHPKRRSS